MATRSLTPLLAGEQWNCLPEKERRVWRRRAALVRTNLAARAASTRAFRRAGVQTSGALRRVEVGRGDVGASSMASQASDGVLKDAIVDSEMHPPEHADDASQASLD